MKHRFSQMEQANIGLIRRWFEEVWNEKRVETIYELMSDNCCSTYEHDTFRSAQQWKERLYDATVRAVPDVHLEIDQIMTHDDRVAVRWKGNGTHTGKLLGVAPSNKPVKVSGTAWHRIAGGQIVEIWQDWNLSYVLRALLTEVAALRQIVPLCSFCKKVRNEEGFWEQVDVYLQNYAQADVSHSLCSECMEREYPEIYAELPPQK